MKLIASVILRNEAARYLEPFVAHLLEFCDEIRCLDDGSTDGWREQLAGAWGKDGARVLSTNATTRDDGSVAFNHHADARNQLLQFTLDGWPTHILAVDADEFVADGAAVRRSCERGRSCSLVMEEIWEVCAETLCVREDGGWRSHPVGMVWAPAMRARASYLIADYGHATGRTPQGVGGGPAVSECLHLGWARESERAERYARYAEGDAGKYHAAAHIASIMAPPERIELRARDWPAALSPWREQILARACAKGGEPSTASRPREVVKSAHETG